MHNGAGMSFSGLGGEVADLSTDTPLGLADGHAEIRMKNDFKTRVHAAVSPLSGNATGTIY